MAIGLADGNGGDTWGTELFAGRVDSAGRGDDAGRPDIGGVIGLVGGMELAT